jgi:DNA-binding response OmpR family regulator
VTGGASSRCVLIVEDEQPVRELLRLHLELAGFDVEEAAEGDTESDKVLGLESGADDYLTKPFGVRELVARVGAIMRRQTRAADRRQAPGRASTTHVQLDPERREAIVRGQRVELTRQEFDLLYQLARRPGIVYSRAQLLQDVWSDDTYVTERTVDSLISRLRRKIERDPQDPELIVKRVQPGVLVTPIIPPWRSTIAFAIDRPSPLPAASAARAGSTL